MMSSVMPSLMYSCSGSPLIFAKGRTTIEGFSEGAFGGSSSAAGAEAAGGPRSDDAVGGPVIFTGGRPIRWRHAWVSSSAAESPASASMSSESSYCSSASCRRPPAMRRRRSAAWARTASGSTRSRRARMGQRRRRRDLGALDKRPQDQPMQPAGLLALGHAPGVEFGAIRQRQAFGKLAMKCRRGGFQRLRRGGIDARGQGAPHGQEIDLDVGNIDPNAIAFRNDPRAARAIHDGAQLAQGRAQGPARIIWDVPEDRAEPAAPVGRARWPRDRRAARGPSGRGAAGGARPFGRPRFRPKVERSAQSVRTSPRSPVKSSVRFGGRPHSARRMELSSIWPNSAT